MLADQAISQITACTGRRRRLSEEVWLKATCAAARSIGHIDPLWPLAPGPAASTSSSLANTARARRRAGGSGFPDSPQGRRSRAGRGMVDTSRVHRQHSPFLGKGDARLGVDALDPPPQVDLGAAPGHCAEDRRTRPRVGSRPGSGAAAAGGWRPGPSPRRRRSARTPSRKLTRRRSRAQKAAGMQGNRKCPATLRRRADDPLFQGVGLYRSAGSGRPSRHSATTAASPSWPKC